MRANSVFSRARANRVLSLGEVKQMPIDKTASHEKIIAAAKKRIPDIWIYGCLHAPYRNCSGNECFRTV